MPPRNWRATTGDSNTSELWALEVVEVAADGINGSMTVTSWS